jgi:hypothetical protein
VADRAQTILDARSAYPNNTLADLYHPLAMPKDLLDAHRALDYEVDRLYGRGSFDEVTRLVALLRRYQQLTSLTAPGGRRRRAA